MYRVASITAYDMLQDVKISAKVDTYHDLSSDLERSTFTASVQVSGTGETDDARWLRDALVALAESL